MSTYFMDTSALVKRYTPAEQGHTWIVSVCNPVQGHKIYIAQATLVEAVAAICRKYRERSITITDRDRLITRFRKDIQRNYDLWRVTTAVYTFAGNLCRLYNLRAYDAVQLACALGLRDEALAIQAPAPVFVCADINLCDIAASEGLSVENPINYP